MSYQPSTPPRPPQPGQLPYILPQYYAPPQTVVSVRKMGFVGHGIHLTLCLFTGGLWIPVYLSRLRSRKTVTRAY